MPPPGQPHRGEALLPARGGEPGRGADEDEHREQQGERQDAEHGDDRIRVVAGTGADSGDRYRAGHVGKLAGPVADDDEQLVR